MNEKHKENNRHLITLARRAGQPHATNSEKAARRVLEALMEDVIGLDQSAVAGIGGIAEAISVGGFEAIDSLRAAIDPRSPENTEEHFLDLRLEPSGKRHYLEARPVKCGDLIEIWVQATGWELARYEYAFGDGPPWANFSEDEAIPIRDDTPCRWPE